MPIKVAKARMENEHLRRRIGIFSVVNFAAALGPTQSHLAKRIHGLGWSNQLGRGWQKQNMVIRRHCLPLAVMNLEFYNATSTISGSLCLLAVSRTILALQRKTRVYERKRGHKLLRLILSRTTHTPYESSLHPISSSKKLSQRLAADLTTPRTVDIGLCLQDLGRAWSGIAILGL